MTMNAKRLYFSRLAPEWDTIPRSAEASLGVRRFVRRSANAQAHRILDVGCGTGILLPDLLAACRKATCIVELDFAEQMLRENRRKATDARVRPVCADARTLPFPEACFDLVLCFGVLPHLGVAQTAVDALLRVLRTSGFLSFGHLMGSAELNTLHQSVGEPLSEDVLPAAGNLAEMLHQRAATVLAAEESSDWYFVQAIKEHA